MRIPIFEDVSPESRARTVETFEQALARHPSSPWAEFDRVNIDLHSGRTDAAIERLQKLTESEDLEIAEHAYSQLAQLHHFAGNDDRAIELYRRAVDLEGRPGHATSFLAAVHADMGNLVEAEKLFRSVLDSLGDDDDLLAFGTGQEFARLLHETDRTAEAVILLKDLIARYPERFELRGVLKFYEPDGAV